MKRLLLLLAFLFPSVAWAQANVAIAAYKYDLASTSYTYCSTLGQQGNPYGPPMNVNASVKTAGSSTTVTENVASTNPFTNVAVGDVIYVRPVGPTGVTSPRLVTARASAASITVDVAVDLTGGSALSYKSLRCGTTSTSGWIPASGSGATAFTLEYNVGDFTSIDWRVECMTSAPGAEAVQVYPSTGAINYATPGITGRGTFVLVDPVYAYCRIGVKYNTTDGGTRDEINMTVVAVAVK